MSPKFFLGLLVITVVTTAAAVVTALEQPTAAPVRFVDEPAFPALRADPDAVAKVVLTTPEGSFTLVRETGDRWSALERAGYPVDQEQIRELIVALADMRLIEAKTERPERYSRLEVEDVDAEGAKSRLLRVESADGAVLAEAILGKRVHRLTGGQPTGIYLRRPGEARSWLASGGVQIETEVVGWLEEEIVDIDAERLRRLEIQPEDGQGYVVSREAPDDELAFEDLAPGETVKANANLDQLASALAGVRLEDVEARSEFAWPAAHTTVRATTFDGVELTVQLAKIGEEHWARFDAREVAAVAPPPATGQAATGADAADAATDAGEDAADEAASAPPPDAETINQRVAKWTYRLPAYLYNRLTKPRSDWLEEGGTS